MRVIIFICKLTDLIMPIGFAKWEKENQEFDLGLDFGLLNNRVINECLIIITEQHLI